MTKQIKEDQGPKSSAWIKEGARFDCPKCTGTAGGRRNCALMQHQVGTAKLQADEIKDVIVPGWQVQI